MGMELFLNVVWVLAAAGVIGVWRVYWVHQQRSRPDSFKAWTAISVALVLLFFAVSMTDDLRSPVVLMEECSTSRRSLSCSAASHRLPHSGTITHAQFPAIVPHVLLAAPPLAIQTVEPLTPQHATPLQNNRLSGRSPPACSL
jgi:hypothetical protein